MYGRAVADALTARLRGVGVEHRGHEDRTARGVEVENFGCVGRQAEAVLRRPPADGLAATTQDRDVERVDPDLLEDDRVLVPRRARQRQRRAELLRGFRLANETLERPVAAADDVARDARQRHERAEPPAAASELERRDVVLDAVVVAGERRGAEQIDGTVRT